MKLTTDPHKAINRFSKLNFKKPHYILMVLYMVKFYKKTYDTISRFLLDAVLENLSQLNMIEFDYDVITKHFRNNNHLIYSDTESLVCNIKNQIFINGLSRIENILIYQNQSMII